MGPQSNQMAMGGSPGECSLKLTEYLCPVKLKANNTEGVGGVHLSFAKTDDIEAFPFLRKMVKLFDRIRWNSIVVEYVPIASALTGGNVVIGMDWGAASITSNTYGKIATTSPNTSTPVSKGRVMTLPKSQLMVVKYYPTDEAETVSSENTVGSIVWGVMGDAPTTDKALGILRITYSVTLQGTTTAR